MIESLAGALPYLGVIISGGVAWGVTTATITHTEKDVAGLFHAMETHDNRQRSDRADTVDRLARIETKLDALLKV